MKGYKATNGNYITGKEIEASRRKFKAEQIISRKAWAQSQEIEDKIKTAQICYNMLEQIKQEEKQKEIGLIKDSVLLALRQNNPFTYPQYLIIWDILNNDYDQILISLHRGKISKQDITNAIEYVNNFSIELIDQFWQKRLLSA